MSKPLTLGQATVGIITALTKELSAARLVFSPNVRAAGQFGDVYHLCEVPCVDGSRVVAISVLPNMGNNFASIQTTNLLHDCRNVHDIIMVGIAGAIPCPQDASRHVRLGDIVVSDKGGVIQFDFGKQEQDKPFQCRAVSALPSALLLRAVNLLLSDEQLGLRPWEEVITRIAATYKEWARPPSDSDVLDDGAGLIEHPVDHKRRHEVPRLFTGAIASSNTLLKDAGKRNALATEHSGARGFLHCVEMEGSGVQSATWMANAGWLIIRGTCDYCNIKKGELWQEYAALVAAAFARAVIEALPANHSSSTQDALPPDAPDYRSQSFGQIFSPNAAPIINISGGSVCFNFGAIPNSTLSTALSTQIGSDITSAQPQVAIETPSLATKDAEQILKSMRDSLAVWNYDQAALSAGDFESLVSRHSNSIRDEVLLEGTILLARVFINQAELSSDNRGNYVSRAKMQLERAKALFVSSSEFQPEMAALNGSLESVDKGPDAGLALLFGRNDPHALRTRIVLLLNKNRLADAMAVIKDLEPHERWCDVAAAVYALNGQLEKAQSLLQWAACLPDRSRYLQCCVRLAEALLSYAISGHQKGEDILPVTVTASEREQLVPVLDTLRPVLDLIRAAGKPSSGLDMAALRIAWQTNHLLQRRTDIPEFLNLMAKWTPVSLDVARGVINAYIEVPSDLTDRLRKDHPNDLNAGIMAAVIDSFSTDRDINVVARAKELLPLADTDAKKEELFKLFQQLWQDREGTKAEACEKIIGSLVAHNPLLKTTFEASIALRNKDADRAILILEGQKVETDPYWLQMRANACLLKGQLPEAIEFLLVVAKMTLDQGLLLKTGEIAFQAKNIDVAVWCFEKFALMTPDNLPIRKNLAHIYTFLLHDLENAAIQFRALRRIEPANPTYTLNLAICLAQLFRPEESLSLYNELCAHESPSLAVVMGRAQLHHSMGHPETALNSLEPFRDGFWGDPTFVMAYMSTAYAAGKEDVAHDAMLALNRMQKEGAVKPEAFRSVATDEALEIFKQSFKQTQERNEFMHTQMLKGQMPWVWAEQISNNAIYWGWRTRTQKMDWIGEEPINLARLCIYSTNGFHARDTGGGKRALLPQECPPCGSRVVADISALITLHRLGLLDAAAEYFGEVLVPAGYLPTVLEDSRQMVLNQRSRQQSAEQITKQINVEQIVALAETAETPQGIPVVDEYSESAEHRYRLVDITQPLYAAGILSDADLARVSRVSAKSSAVDAEHPALVQCQNVMVDLTTLETMAHSGLLVAVTGFFKVHITAQANRNVIQNLNAIACQEETRVWHMDMWNRIRSDTRFKFVVHTVPNEMRQKDQKEKDYLPFLSNFIAQETDTPLLADDRVCQAFMLSEAKGVPNAASGSDALILALLAESKLDACRAAAAFRQLIAWRYKFLIPPPEILKVWADSHRGNPPGQALREVAEYVHDCMRDPGLFGGPENTELGDSMAMRAYLTWSSTIAEFLVKVWADESFTQESAKRLTTWSCDELLPSCPMAANGRMKVRISNMTLRLFLSHVLVKTANRNKVPRMADAMVAIKEALRLTDETYQRIVLEILNDTARTSTHA